MVASPTMIRRQSALYLRRTSQVSKRSFWRRRLFCQRFSYGQLWK
ncbi:Uncharacterised protein [Bordetella pertussis]|nr:Uncharacterised protein [Bordetella pertussis]CPM04276.1 Uncharacterised protein [Bordetella pertussis]CPM42733.1 Uncharacterised protein [Bordetella pertussis]